MGAIRNQEGAALITTLLISLMIIAVSMLVTSLVRGKIRTAVEIKAGVAASVKVDNVLQEALFVLSTHRFEGVGIQWREDDKIITWPFDDRPIPLLYGNVSIQDTSGIFPLWPFDSSKWEKLLLQHGVPESDSRIFLDSLSDWRDEDDLKHLNGAERMAYREMGLNYGPRNDYWQSRGELLLVYGMTPKIWQVIKEKITPSLGYFLNPLTLRESLLPVVLSDNEKKIEQLLTLKKKGLLHPNIFFALFPEYRDSMSIAFSPSRRLLIRAVASEGEIACTKEMIVLFREKKFTPFQMESRRDMESWSDKTKASEAAG